MGGGKDNKTLDEFTLLFLKQERFFFMKKTLLMTLLTGIAAIAFFTGCEKRASSENAKPVPVHHDHDGHDHSSHDHHDGHAH